MSQCSLRIVRMRSQIAFLSFSSRLPVPLHDPNSTRFFLWMICMHSR